MTVSFTAYGIARSKGSTKSFIRWKKDKLTGRRTPFTVTTSDNDRLKPWEHDIRAAIQIHVRDGSFFPKGTPVAVRLVFHLPRPTSAPRRVVLPTTMPDLDKLCRAALDSCTGKLWADDSQVVEIAARKVYTIETPKTEFVITDVDVQPSAPVTDITLPLL